eukprot:scaffold80765_cov33-Tisochrysis_lutea.AAC.2
MAAFSRSPVEEGRWRMSGSENPCPVKVAALDLQRFLWLNTLFYLYPGAVAQDTILRSCAGGESQIPYTLHEAHGPILVTFDNHKRDQDVTKSRGDRVSTVKDAGCVRHDVSPLNRERLAQSLEPGPSTLIIRARV